MARKILWICVGAAFATLLPEPADADKLRWRSRVRNFPVDWCLIEGDEANWRVFRTDTGVARITFTADQVPDQRIDNIYVVEKAVYDSLLNLAEFANVECTETPVYDFNATAGDEAFLATFDDGADGWELYGASWAPGSAPRNPFGSPDAVGGSIRLDPGSTASVLVTGLQAGVDYVVGGWWSTQLEGQQLTVDVDTEPDIALFLQNDRFEVEVEWSTGPGGSGTGRGIPLTNETGYIWFFHPQNVEVVIKVLNGCGLNSRYWVFIAGLTDVEVDILVRDTSTGATKRYRNPRGTRFQAVQDTGAFAGCP